IPRAFVLGRQKRKLDKTQFPLGQFGHRVVVVVAPRTEKVDFVPAICQLERQSQAALVSPNLHLALGSGHTVGDKQVSHLALPARASKSCDYTLIQGKGDPYTRNRASAASARGL